MEFYEQCVERQISFRDMFYRILINWRKILVVSLILSLICGCYNIISQVKGRESIRTAFSSNMEVYQKEQAIYEKSRTDLENEITDIMTNIERLSNYNENSLRMKIDPFEKYTSSLVFYVNTDYQINPNLTYQNIDNTKSILKAYSELFNDGEMYDYIIQNLPYKTEVRYIRELISLYADYDTNLLYAIVIQKDKESSEELINLINDQLILAKQRIESSVGEHELIKLQNSTQSSIDTDLDSRQKINIQNLIDYNLRLVEKNNALEVLVAPVKPVLNDNFLINSMIKYSVIGFILGTFLEMLIIVISLMTDSKLLGHNDYKQHFNYNVIGTVRKDSKKRVFGFIDQLISRLFSEDIKYPSYSEEIRIVNARIRAYLKNEQIGEKRILFTGSASKERIIKIYDDIIKEDSDMSKFNIECIASMNYSSMAIEKLACCDLVVLFEEIGYSTYEEISNGLETINRLNKEIIGVILI